MRGEVLLQLLDRQLDHGDIFGQKVQRINNSGPFFGPNDQSSSTDPPPPPVAARSEGRILLASKALALASILSIVSSKSAVVPGLVKRRGLKRATTKGL